MLLHSPIRVYLHIEEFNTRYNLLHIGISFENDYKRIRYDFKEVSPDGDYITYSKIHLFETIYPEYENDYIPEIYDILHKRYVKNKNIETMKLYWGITNYTFDEIHEYENSLHRKYRLGLYDCRHYTRQFTKWAVSKPSPVWKLHKLFYY